MELSNISTDSSSSIGNTKNNRPNSDLLNNTVQTFEDVMQSLTESQTQADDLMSQLAAGEDVDVHDVMIAMEQSDLNFRVSMAIRNRIVEAYKEVIHLQI
jgi:flagellar hook-basal body complex protein FliE